MTKADILNIIYKNSYSSDCGLHISFKQLESIVELLANGTKRSQVELAQEHMKTHGITFGSAYGDEMGIDLFIAGMEAQKQNK